MRKQVWWTAGGNKQLQSDARLKCETQDNWPNFDTGFSLNPWPHGRTRFIKFNYVIQFLFKCSSRESLFCSWNLSNAFIAWMLRRKATAIKAISNLHFMSLYEPRFYHFNGCEVIKHYVLVPTAMYKNFIRLLISMPLSANHHVGLPCAGMSLGSSCGITTVTSLWRTKQRSTAHHCVCTLPSRVMQAFEDRPFLVGPSISLQDGDIEVLSSYHLINLLFMFILLWSCYILYSFKYTSSNLCADH